jgi:hypothetical protein
MSILAKAFGTRGALLVLVLAASPVATPANAAGTPWSWSVDEREPAAIGIPLTRTGTIAVRAQASGVPIRLRLLDGAGRVVAERTGAGAVPLEFAVDEAALRSGPVWQARIEPAEPGRATGTLHFDAPPADQRVIAAALERRRVASEAEAAQTRERPPVWHDARSGRDRFHALEEQRRAQIFERIRPEFELARARQATGDRPATPQPPPGEVRSRSIGSGRIDARRQAWQPPPAPAIVSVSLGSGRPGDPVMITGSGFGTGGQVRFVIGPTLDIPAPTTAVWSDGQVFTSVPARDGIATGYSGVVYVQRADGSKSNAVPFRFEPALDHHWLPMPPTEFDRSFSNVSFWTLMDGADVKSGVSNTIYMQTGDGGLFGFKGNDRYFLTTRLKNGWRVNDVELLLPDPSGVSGAYVNEYRPGTDSPYVDVRVWLMPMARVRYMLRIGIVGPRGVPFR